MAEATQAEKLTGVQKLVPDRLAHVVFRTQNVDPMAESWLTLLQADIAFRSEFICFLRFDDEHHRVAIVKNPNVEGTTRSSAGLDHVAFTYAGLDELIHTYERLRDQGIVPAWVVNHGPTLSMYYKDPDGNRVELQIDRYETVEEANEFFASPTFAANPIGITVDMEDLAKRYHAGEPHASIIAYTE